MHQRQLRESIRVRWSGAGGTTVPRQHHENRGGKHNQPHRGKQQNQLKRDILHSHPHDFRPSPGLPPLIQNPNAIVKIASGQSGNVSGTVQPRITRSGRRKTFPTGLLEFETNGTFSVIRLPGQGGLPFGSEMRRDCWRDKPGGRISRARSEVTKASRNEKESEDKKTRKQPRRIRISFT